MRGIQINSFGAVDVLEINKNIFKPSVDTGKVLVTVYAAGINPFDSKFRSGIYKGMIPVTFPFTMGGDFAGVISETGAGVTDYKIGDEVYGTANILSGGTGAFADMALVPTENIYLKPNTVGFTESAAMPLVGVSAIQALIDHIQLKSGQKILIHGGAGGIGSVAIQLAKSIGAYVATTVGTNSIEFIKTLGADQVIDYQNEKFEDIVKDFDAVYDTVGGQTTNKSFLILKKGGILVSMLGKPDENLAQQYGVTVIGQGTKTDTTHLKQLTELVDSGKIKVQIAMSFPMDQVQEAFTYAETAHKQGKVVLKLKN
jgi:alcohol dehydrogenase